MTHTEQPKKRSLGWGLISMTTCAVAITLMMIASFGVSLMFDFRHTTAFATEELNRHGFEQVDVLKEYTIGRGMGMPSLPVENWFDFVATKNGKNVEGRLICYRQYWDIEKSRCEVEKN